MNNQFVSELLRRHKAENEKLKKFKRVLFKRFGPNVNDISDEFNQLAIEFKNSSLLEYAGISWQNSAECEHIMENSHAEIEYLLKAARSYHEAEEKLEDQRIRSNDRCFIECALQCYDRAIGLSNDSPMKSAIVRETIKLKPSVTVSANGLVSPSHRIYGMEKAADEDIRTKDFMGALDKRTEIYNTVTERNVQHLYAEVLKRNEITRMLLLILLELPPSKQSESHVKLIQKFSTISSEFEFAEELDLFKELFLCISEFVLECQNKRRSSIDRILDQLFELKSLTSEQYMLLEELNKKFTEYLNRI